jgi:hypothetical protein
MFVAVETKTHFVALKRALEAWSSGAIDNLVAGILAQAREEPFTENGPWGRSPDASEFAGALAKNELRLAARREEAKAGSVTLPAAAMLLSVAEPEVRQQIENRELLAFEDGVDVWIPVWQFDKGGRRTPGVQALGEAFGGDSISLTRWLARPNVNLNWETPISNLRRGELENVLRAVPPPPGL